MSIEPLHIFLEGLAISTCLRTQEVIPLQWTGDSNYHYRRKSSESQKGKNRPH